MLWNIDHATSLGMLRLAHCTAILENRKRKGGGGGGGGGEEKKNLATSHPSVKGQTHQSMLLQECWMGATENHR